MTIKNPFLIKILKALISITFLAPIVLTMLVLGSYVWLDIKPDHGLLIGVPSMTLFLSFFILQSYRGLILQEILLINFGTRFQVLRNQPSSFLVTDFEAFLLGCFWFILALISSILMVEYLFTYLPDGFIIPQYSQ